MKHLSNVLSRSLLCAMAGAVTALMVAGNTAPALAQASDAADRCTPDVMRLCSELIPDQNRIVACLKAKRKRLSPSCLSALTSGKGSQKAKKRRARRHNS